MKISKHCVVAIFYTLCNDEGEQLDASGEEALIYLHGGNNLIRGLEQELDGKQAGDSFQACVDPELAYGEIDDQLIQDVPRNLLAEIDNLHVGMALQSKTEEGHMQRLVIDAVNEDSVTVNANHPLAGMTLHFDVTIDSVRQATEEEVEHGHPHSH